MIRALDLTLDDSRKYWTMLVHSSLSTYGLNGKPALWFWEEIDQPQLPPVSPYSNFWIRHWVGV